MSAGSGRGTAVLRAVGCLAAVLLLGSLSAGALAAPPPNPGDRPPAFNLKDLDGRPRALADLEGKVVSLHFFALWCEPCLGELHEVEKTAARFRARGYRAILVAVKHRLQADRLREFARERGMEVEILLDEKGQVQKAYGVDGIPYAVLVGRDGKVSFSGARLPEDFGRRVEKLVTRKER